MTSRAIVFDLDDTLYRERRFALSGYRAVADTIARDGVADGASAFRFLALALRRGRRPRAFQELASWLGVPDSSVPAWIERYRTHDPGLRLSPAVRGTLAALRGRWRVGVLTNGFPAVQAAKVKALGLDRLVDAVTYADAFGGGKPHPAAFLEILRRLGTDPANTVFAGNDPGCDIAGAKRVGMRTVLVGRRGTGVGGNLTGHADAVVDRVADVAEAAERLVSGESGHVH